MLTTLRRAFRRAIPRPRDPWLDAPVADAPVDRLYSQAFLSALHESERSDSFARGRFEDGKRWRGILHRLGIDNGVVLDIASGNGGVALALAAAGKRVVTVDRGWSETARLAHLAARTPYRHVIADAAALPFASGVFHAIVSLDSFEHFEQPRQTASELSRVARGGAPLAVETPGRLTYLFRPDPHYNIRGLLLLPTRLQQKLAVRRGYNQPHHHVHRIYTSAHSIARYFPGCSIERILGRSRLPKRWFFSAVILRKQ